MSTLKGKFGVSALTFALAAAASVATAHGQTGGWSPVDDPSERAARAHVATVCGQPLFSVTRTQNAALETSSTTFATVPGAVQNVVVPAGQVRCIKVLFTAEVSCTDAFEDICYIRATDNGVEMHPSGGGAQALSSESFLPESGAYEWVRRVGPGTHTIRIQGRVDDSDTEFVLDDWTFDVQVLRSPP
jgi:hypothetical protein